MTKQEAAETLISVRERLYDLALSLSPTNTKASDTAKRLYDDLDGLGDMVKLLGYRNDNPVPAMGGR